MKKRVFFSSLVTVLLLVGCGSGGTSSTDSEIVVSPSSSNEEVDTTTENQEEIEYEYEFTSNEIPTVNAGADKTVTVNETVILNGSASDSDGTIVSYEWTKGDEVLGTEVTLSYTPTVEGTDTLTLTVMDDDGNVASDSVNITVMGLR